MYDKKNLDKMAQRYKDEMMKLYNQNKPSAPAAVLPLSKPAVSKPAVPPPVQGIKPAVSSIPITPYSPPAVSDEPNGPFNYTDLVLNGSDRKTVYDEEVSEQCNDISCKFMPASEIMKMNTAVPASAPPQNSSQEVSRYDTDYPNMDGEDEFVTDNLETVYEEDNADTIDENYDDGMPMPPDIEVPQEVMAMLEQTRNTAPIVPTLPASPTPAAPTAPATPATPATPPVLPAVPPIDIRERSSDQITDFISDLVTATGDTETGYLQIEVTAADDAVPVRNAVVIVSREAGDKNYLLSILTTDSSGRTPAISLPAPVKEQTEDPAVILPKTPYADYQVRVEADGFYPAGNTAVPVFASIKSIQPFELIPLPEYTVQPAQTTIKTK